jgi:hypothetical protein
MLEDCWILHTRHAVEQSLSDTDIGLISAGGYREAVARHLPGATVSSSPSKVPSASACDGDSNEAASTRSHQLFLKMQSSDFSAISDASAPAAGASVQPERPDCRPRWQSLRIDLRDSLIAAVLAAADDPEGEYSSSLSVTELPTFPGRKTGHSLAFFPGAGVLMFGGVGSDQIPSNDLWRMQVALGVATLGTPPAPRAFHGCCSHFTNMIVAGGEDSCVLGDVHVLDTVTMTWSQPVLPAPLPPAKALQLSLVGDHLIIFGGEDRTYQPCNAATIFHVGHSDKTAFTISSPLLHLTGEAPLPRHSHSGCGLGGLVVWGGQGQHFYGDFWVAVEDADEKKVSPSNSNMYCCLAAHASNLFNQARETAEEAQR